jgi:hypothetical protein
VTSTGTRRGSVRPTNESCNKPSTMSFIRWQATRIPPQVVAAGLIQRVAEALQHHPAEPVQRAQRSPKIVRDRVDECVEFPHSHVELTPQSANLIPVSPAFCVVQRHVLAPHAPSS